MINSKELLFVVDENNIPLEPKPRDEVHAKGYWHRNTHLWIVNDKGELLCQQRSQLKDSNPGMMESFFGGHTLAGEEYKESGIKELEEELGLKVAPDELEELFLYKNEKDKEFQKIYKIHWNGDIKTLHLEPDEVAEISWITVNDVYNALRFKENWSVPGYFEKVMVEFNK